MSQRPKWLDLVRFNEWQDTKLPLLALVVYQFFIPGRLVGDFWKVWGLSMLYGGALLAFGYLINDLSDLDVDRKAGKKRPIMLLSPASAWSICGGLFLIAAVSLFPAWGNPVAMLLLVASLVLAAGYSLKPLRFKEHGAIGLYVASAAQRSIPALAIATCWGQLSAGTIWMSVIFLLMGLRYILLHQAMDAASDRAAGVRTYLLEGSHFEKITHYLDRVFILELGAIGLLPLFLGDHSYTLWVVILPYLLYWVFRSRSNIKKMGIIHPVTYIVLPLQTFYFLAWPAGLIGMMLWQQASLWPIVLIEAIWKFRTVKSMQTHFCLLSKHKVQ